MSTFVGGRRETGFEILCDLTRKELFRVLFDGVFRPMPARAVRRNRVASGRGALPGKSRKRGGFGVKYLKTNFSSLRLSEFVSDCFQVLLSVLARFQLTWSISHRYSVNDF